MDKITKRLDGVALQYKNRVSLLYNEYNLYGKMVTWCMSYIGYYFFDRSRVFACTEDGKQQFSCVFAFAKNEDAVAFKLRWA